MTAYTLGDPVDIRCQMTTVSRILRDTQIERVDLLKIDAEKSELQILEGIDTAEWPKIQQIVLEAHSPEDAGKMRGILLEKGFETVLEQENQLVNSGVYNCFAVRRRTGW